MIALLTGLVSAIAALARAWAAYNRTLEIRTLNTLRNERRRLHKEIMAAADAGNDRLLHELQDAYADNERDAKALRTPA